MGNDVGGLFAAAALATVVLLGAGAHALAEGALAVGSTGDVIKDGVAFGMVVNEPKDKAAETAVKRCRTFKARAAADRCQVVATFSGECFAVAYDPQPGTPGAGWGIGPDQLSANLKAIAMCEETAGSGRKGFCQVETGGCDTTSEPGTETARGNTAEPPRPEAAKPVPHQAPASDQQWTELRKELSEEAQSQGSWDMPALLLLAGAIAWVAYAVGYSLLSRRKADPSVGKPSKGKTRQSRR